MTLQQHLNAWYSAKVLSTGSATKASEKFRAALEEDAELRAAAEDRLATYTQPVLDRDHTARIFHDYLEDVLG